MEHFPRQSDSFLLGQSILYSQFNSVDFFVEDADQEHLYFNVLKFIFKDVRFEKIFPLNGKTNVINEARRNIGDHSKVHIVDLDFDRLLGNIKNLPNLFYLDKYSIENCLLTKIGVFELIRNKQPNLKDVEIDQKFNYSTSIELAAMALTEASIGAILIQEYGLGMPYVGICPARDSI